MGRILIDFFLFSSFASYMSILRLTANILCRILGGASEISSDDYQIRKYQRDSLVEVNQAILAW